MNQNGSAATYWNKKKILIGNGKLTAITDTPGKCCLKLSYTDYNLQAENCNVNAF